MVLLHGWGMNGDVWEGVLPALAKDYRVTTVDLPGHGRSVDVLGDYSLADLARQVVDVMPEQACLVGWSLGGMVATQIALDFPQRLNKLVLVASAPRFTRDSTWPDGVEAEVLDKFAGDLRADFRNTIKRFIAIQTLGSDNAREEQRVLRERVFRHGQPSIAALEGGLKLLHDTDLRAELGRIIHPTLLLSGEHDSLFRQEAAQAARDLFPQARLHVIKGAGHAPFLSHAHIFCNELLAFANE
jgi:pimeloyl-[acyl-carrier protein] methyl ester esterase